MDNSTSIVIVVAIMAALSIGGLGYFLISPSLEKKQRSNQRLEAITRGPQARTAAAPGEENTRDRRKQVKDALKELEENQKKRKQQMTLRRRIEQAGLDISTQTFYTISAFVALIGLLIGFVTGQAPGFILMLGFAFGLGLPRWALGFMKKSREKKFAEEFTVAIDVIVRGVRSGLPVNDCLKIIARENKSPVKEEFALMIDGIRVGLSLEQALHRMYDRMSLAEVNFFGIVLIIQQKTGGNLAEALHNLSEVLRGRKRMKGKIDAMSSEAKASAGIIGSLPFFVAGIIYLLRPDYMLLLVQTPLGKLMLIGSAIWMSMGIIAMKTMISFKI